MTRAGAALLTTGGVREYDASRRTTRREVDLERITNADGTIRWWCEWCLDTFEAPVDGTAGCPMCGHGIDDQVDPADDDIGVYPMGQKGPFKMARATKRAAPRRRTRTMKEKVERVLAKTAARKAHTNGAAAAGLDLAALKAGTKLVASYKGETVKAAIVETSGKEEGRGAEAVAVRYAGQNYASLSAAAKAVTGGAVNGRKFWAVA